MHGGIMCSIFENEEDHSGHMYCLKCGRLSVETPGCSYKIKPSRTLPRSERMEALFSQSPAHCADMNPSHRNVYPLIHELEIFKNRNIVLEEKYR